MKIIAAVLGVVLVSFAAFILWATGKIGGPDEEQYKADNEQVLASLPDFPGAAFLRSFSHEQHNRTNWPDEVGPPTGWTTSHLYELPDSTSWGKLRSFYVTRLEPEWELTGEAETNMHLVRGRTELYFLFLPEPNEQLSNSKLLQIQVDRDCQVGACLRTAGG